MTLIVDSVQVIIVHRYETGFKVLHTIQVIIVPRYNIGYMYLNTIQVIIVPEYNRIHATQYQDTCYTVPGYMLHSTWIQYRVRSTLVDLFIET